MPDTTPDVFVLEVPDDARFLSVAIATVEALAMQAGVDKDEVAALRDHLEDAVSGRFGKGPPDGRVLLRYEVGDGFLGLRLLDGAGSTSGVTS